MSACAMCQWDEAARVAARWECRISVLAVSQNQLHAKGTNRWAYQKHKRALMTAMEAAWRTGDATTACWLRASKAPRRVTITRYWAKGQRAYDRTNLAGGMKPLLDCLVELGLLVDDSEQWCKDYYRQQGPCDQPGIGVVIEEIAR